MPPVGGGMFSVGEGGGGVVGGAVVVAVVVVVVVVVGSSFSLPPQAAVSAPIPAITKIAAKAAR